ncbi:DUF1868-domain-containing protein [Podospora conica]|nr:DUF1868-domain-containing protein [Schizothecium conicum]
MPSRPDYPLGVPSKFDANGNVQPFPGNTIIAHLPHNSELFGSLLQLHGRLAASPLAPLIALLPPESWHMTLFVGVCDTVRDVPGHWPQDIPTDAPLEQCTQHLARKLSEFELGEDAPPYRLTVDGFSSFDVGILVRLRPRTPEEGTRLRRLRDRLSDTTGLRMPNHDCYELHLSMAYFLRHLDGGQRAILGRLLEDHMSGMPREFELGGPEFCTFEDMFSFGRLFYLG